MKTGLVGWAPRAHRASQPEPWFGGNHLVGTGCPPYPAAFRPAALLASFLAAVFPASSMATKEYMPAPGASELAHVVTFGDWNSGDRIGVVRYVQSSAGIDHSRSRAWVQWVEYVGEMGYSTKIVATREIAVLKGNYGIYVPTPKMRNGKLVLFATHSFEKCTFKVSLTASDIGRLNVEAAEETQSISDLACKIKNNRPSFEQ